jgi:competence ComEA-like helix-hairpin-helix protein
MNFAFCNKRLILLSIPLLIIALASCAKPVSHNSNADARVNQQVLSRSAPNGCINLNTATNEQLIELPGIGEAMSRKIIEYRERHGPFRRPEEIIILENFSEKKYRAIADLICVE